MTILPFLFVSLMWGGRTRRTIPLRALVDTIKSDWKVSVQRACSVLKIDRSLYVYKSRRGEQAELKVGNKNICQTRVRYGYRRVRGAPHARALDGYGWILPIV